MKWNYRLWSWLWQTFQNKERNVSPHSNGQHICPELFYKNRRHNEPENDLSFQGDLGAAVEQQNYSYSRIYAQFA